ncbi:MAG: DUF58 domain-containing protein [Ardenticatenales bacterium]|nr:DUF58 domain-containing protein [Ardenticatenales bacterium]
MITPTRRALALAAMAAAAFAASGRVPVLHWLALASIAVAAAAVAFDAWLAPRARDWDVVRLAPTRLSMAAWNTVPLVVRLRRARLAAEVPFMARDLPPSDFAVAEGERVVAGDVAPGQAVRLAYHVRPPRRGAFAFGDVHIAWRGPLGLAERRARLPLAAPVAVFPNLMDVRKYDLLHRRSALREMGMRPVRIVGTGREFERLRDYTLDDPYRHINWSATARRGTPISVQYQVEIRQNVVAMVDVGRMMRSPVGDVARMDYALNAVLLLCYVAARKGDRIGALTFADAPMQWLAPAGGTAQFHKALELLYAVEGQPVEPDYDAAFAFLQTKLRQRSLVVLFTELTGAVSVDRLVAHVLRLRRHHLPLVVTVADPSVEALAHQPLSSTESLYERTVAERLLAERAAALSALRARGVATLDVPADRLSVAVIDRYLALKARQAI